MDTSEPVKEITIYSGVPNQQAFDQAIDRLTNQFRKVYGVRLEMRAIDDRSVLATNSQIMVHALLTSFPYA